MMVRTWMVSLLLWLGLLPRLKRLRYVRRALTNPDYIRCEVAIRYDRFRAYELQVQHCRLTRFQQWLLRACIIPDREKVREATDVKHLLVQLSQSAT